MATLEETRKTGDEDGATSSDASGVGRPSPQVATAGTKAASASTIFAGTSSPAAAAAASTPADAASAEALRLDSFAQTLGLTPREAEVCRYLVQGRSLPFIAEQLYVTAGTVKTHAIHIYRKAGVTSKQELISLFGESAAQ